MEILKASHIHKLLNFLNFWIDIKRERKNAKTVALKCNAKNRIFLKVKS